jgi:hydroxyethylthiazole kinase-like uncharacterized protein yjeF
VKPAASLTRTALRAFPLPRQADGGKESHGRLLIVAGNRQVPGAAILCATAALRAGAGKVQVATVAGTAPGIAMQMPELLVIPLAESASGDCARSCLADVVEHAQKADAVVAGPGMRQGKVTAMIGKALLGSGRPLALDAGALHALPPLAAHCRNCTIPPVLLPHSGELAAMLEMDEDAVESDRLGAARRAAEHYRAVVLAKGAQSHVAAPDGSAWTFRGGAPGLGVSGSGDTLAGIAGALLARGAEPLTALLWAVLLHGEAGEALARRIGPAGFLAREIPGEVPALLDR